MSEPIDWYDRCQSAEADLLLARAEIKRLRAELNLERRRLATSEDLRTGLARALERRKNER